jgi:hypothetical protein
MWAFAFAALTLAGSCFGYFHNAHTFLGDYFGLHMQLHYPSIVETVSTQIDIRPHQYGKASTWPDEIKFKKEFSWSRQLHYIDINECYKSGEKNFIKQSCVPHCIFDGILNMTNDLKYNLRWMSADERKNIFRFLLHFLQDVNQPMHLFGPYRGGNQYLIVLHLFGKIVRTNMHTLWDSYIPDYFIKHETFNARNITIRDIHDINEYGEFIATNMESTFKQSCSFIYLNNHEINFEKYYDRAVVEFLFQNYIDLAINTFIYIFGQ